MGESVFIRGEVTGRDHRGRPEYAPDREVPGCTVYPKGDTIIKGEDFVHGDISELQVLAPAGTVVKDGDVVVFRGSDYVVTQLESFDRSVGRRPVLARHRPKVEFTMRRGEVSTDVA